jgi:hypothetical protein
LQSATALSLLGHERRLIVLVEPKLRL